MKKNFINPEIKVEAFDLRTGILTLSLTTAEQSVANILGVDISQTKPNGYVYSLKQEQVNQ